MICMYYIHTLHTYIIITYYIHLYITYCSIIFNYSFSNLVSGEVPASPHRRHGARGRRPLGELFTTADYCRLCVCSYNIREHHHLHFCPY